MAGILDFDAAQLDDLIEKYGMHDTWIGILATNFKDQQKFQYILDSDEFSGARFFSTDLLKDLSIGEIGVLYEYSVTTMNSELRKSNGQFFTPDDVALFMANFSKKFPSGKWLDPCSGIGNLSWHLVAIQDEPEQFLVENLVLSDRDTLALLIARTLLTISFQDKERNLFHKIAENFIEFDFLSVSSNEKFLNFDAINSLEKIPKHDFVIVNPPYLATEIDARFETAKSRDLYAYFMENIIKTSKGFISVTPQSFTNAGKFEDLRRLMIENYNKVTIFNFDNVPANIFRGIKFGSKNTNTANSIRAAITIAQPGRGKWKITSLLRWRSHERVELFRQAPKHLSSVEVTEDFFPKVSKKYELLYSQVCVLPRLGERISRIPTPYSLHVPSSPRYFISALKSPVKRASQHEIFFLTSKDRDTAYLLLNSSFMYWWWRVRDGGMTLSQETIHSLPVPSFTVKKNLVTDLEKSEKTSKVYKQNAGSAQENVKHSMDLILQVNHQVLPKFANQLIDLHQNSDIKLGLQESNQKYSGLE
jgi:tRNA1(Val) A37 N6-methylase TrmN6